MRDDCAPHHDVEGPDDGRPPRDASGELARLGGALQRLQQTLEAYDADPRWAALQATHEAVALAHSLLHGWQVQQAMTQGCLTQWQQTLKTLDTAGVALQRQAETHQAQTGQLRRAPLWAFLAGVGLMALVAGWLGGRHTAPPPRDKPAWQALQPVPVVPERLQLSDEHPSPAPDATLTSETHDTPIRDGP